MLHYKVFVVLFLGFDLLDHSDLIVAINQLPILLFHAYYPYPVLSLLLFATNFNATITPQGSSCNAIYLSSGYISARDIYIYGGAVTLLTFCIFILIGTPWILALL